MQTKLKSEIVKQLNKSKEHLNYSFNKVNKYNLNSASLQEDELEALESFAARFSRTSDIIIQKYFRILAIEKDPAYQGSVIDLLNFAEKWKWINSSNEWKRIRELRNLVAHEYSSESFIHIYIELIKLAPTILAVSDKL